MRRIAAVPLMLLMLASFTDTAAGRQGVVRSWAHAQIGIVVDAGLMASSVETFRPNDPLVWSEFAPVVASLGGSGAPTDPDRPVTVRELDAQLVTVAGLRPAARSIRMAALVAGLRPTPFLGTETVARLLGLRINHERDKEALELQLAQPATRAEAAYSIARMLALDDEDVSAVRAAASSFLVPELDEWQRAVLERGLRLVGSPYVWGGTSERPQELLGAVVPGGFDCSGFVWRVYKLEPFAGADALAEVLRGRTSYAMSGEVPLSARVTRGQLQPGDVVFFGPRGPRSKPSEVGHMGIYVGNDWMVHSSRFGTTLAPLTGWYESTFAWARRPLAEAGLTPADSVGAR